MKRLKWQRFLFLLLAASLNLIAFQNCSPFASFSKIDGSNGQSSSGFSEAPSLLACDQTKSGTADGEIRRLTKVELINSLTALFGATLMQQTPVKNALQIIPDQTMPAGSFSKFDNSVTDVRGLLEVSKNIVEGLFADQAALNAVVDGCPQNEDACRKSIVDKFAYRAWRRPLLQEEKDEISALSRSVGGTDGLKFAFMRILLSPNFHQHIEIGSDVGGDAQRIKLTQFEVASRLAFRLSGTLPSAGLLEEARAGRLGTLAEIETQAKLLLATPGARAHWRDFFDRWLDGQRILDPSQLVADELGISATGLKVEGREELLKFADYVTFEKKGTFIDLLTDPTVFPSTDRLAKIFSETRSDGPVVSAKGFAGVVLRPGKLFAGGNYTAPITRGVYVQKFLLCNALPSPPPAIVASRSDDIEKYSHDLYSSREITAAVTAGNTCMGCHSTINPTGFALENFGPLGRPRTAEAIFDSAGNVGRSHAINSNVDNLPLGGTRVAAADATDFVGRLARSAAAKSCFSQKLVEATRYRELSDADNCVVNKARTATHVERPVIDVILTSVVNDSLLWKSNKGVSP